MEQISLKKIEGFGIFEPFVIWIQEARKPKAQNTNKSNKKTKTKKQTNLFTFK